MGNDKPQSKLRTLFRGVVKGLRFGFWLAVIAIILVELGYIDLSESRPERTYPEIPKTVTISQNLDPAQSTAASGLTDHERYNRLIRATVQIRIDGVLGSGVVLDNKKCLVATNNHVIDVAGVIDVGYIAGFRTLDNSPIIRFTTGRIIGHPSPENDLALLEIRECETLPWAPLGDSFALRPMDDVIASGHPEGNMWSINPGVISQPHRYMDAFTGRTGWPVLQTDTAINPGNSGGPLFNKGGEVVGINSFKQMDAEGLGYARSSDLLKVYLEYISLHGYMPSSLAMGVVVSELDAIEAADLGVNADAILAGHNGVLVAEVVADSTAESAGLMEGDVILTLGGEEIYDFNHLVRQIYRVAPAGEATMTVLRLGKVITLNPVFKMPAPTLGSTADDAE